MILKHKRWDKDDLAMLLDSYRLSHEQFQTLTGIPAKQLEQWLSGKSEIDSVSCFALDRITQLLKDFFVKRD
ncbi:MAG: hypothetical protein KDH97_13545 [Calditrichaeota bacterium]|nr:hypothetical protein [Calditrichota bacterium]MCB0306511.1 hypothetical protein [Calditrichota bacterium]MCB9088326.1 hypothetical protein [Calditrichia bacterium]